MCINIKDKARNITFFPHSLYPYITFPNVSDVDPSLFQVHTKPPTILIAGDSLHSKSPSDDKVEILFLSIVSILVFCKQTNSTYSFIIQALITLHLIFPPNPLTLWLVIFIKYSYHVPPPSLCNYFFQFEIYPFFFLSNFDTFQSISTFSPLHTTPISSAIFQMVLDSASSSSIT